MGGWVSVWRAPNIRMIYIDLGIARSLTSLYIARMFALSITSHQTKHVDKASLAIDDSTLQRKEAGCDAQ
jgi:hypothetical protein